MLKPNDREAVEQRGYDLDTTPIDVLMEDGTMGLHYAYALEHSEDEDRYPE